MTEENKVPTVVVNDKEYEIDSLNNEQKYAISQLRDISNKLNDLSFQAEYTNWSCWYVDTLRAYPRGTKSRSWASCCPSLRFWCQ